MLIIYKMTGSNVTNIGDGDSPLPHKIVKLMQFKTASSSGEFDSLKKLNAKARDAGSQGNVNAYKILGLIVG